MEETIYQSVWCQVFAATWAASDKNDPLQQRLKARQEADYAAAEAVRMWDEHMRRACITAKTKATPLGADLPTADDFTIDGEFVEFYADGEEAPCEALKLRIDSVEEDGDVYFSLYCDGTMHDGHSALSDTERAFPKVAVDLDDWKAGRLVPFAVVRAAAFALAGVEDPEIEDA